jgi:hypothetical protein
MGFSLEGYGFVDLELIAGITAVNEVTSDEKNRNSVGGKYEDQAGYEHGAAKRKSAMTGRSNNFKITGSGLALNCGRQLASRLLR